MKLKKAIVVFLTILFSSQIYLGQELEGERNWYKDTKGIDDYYSKYRYKFYTRDDVEKAIKKYYLIQEYSFNNNEWEGVYTTGTMLGHMELRWNAAGGFVISNLYHSLDGLDFGSAKDKTDSVKLTSEKSSKIKRKSIFSTNLIKVKYGDKHFLVPEKRLRDFAKRAVGLSSDLQDYGYYLYKIDEIDNKIYGLPEFPKKYRHFLRLPIETQITNVGKRIIHQNKFDDGRVNYEVVYLYVTLGAGKNEKVRVGMHFFVEELNEWIEIIKVNSVRSFGRIKRDFFNETGKETCREMELGQGIGTPCLKIKVGMKVATKVSESYF